MGRKEKRAAEKAKRESIVTVDKVKVPKLVYIVIAAFAILLYSNTFDHDYALDDDVITRANRYVQMGYEGIPLIFKKGFYHGFNNVNEGSYRPIVLMNMAIEKELFGNDPKYGHIFNVLFYALSALLLFSFLRNLLREKSWHFALVITLLFVAHPIHTEVVANIKSRDEILCFLFIVSSLNMLILYTEKRHTLFMVGSLLFYFISLLTKEYGITLMAVIPCMLYMFTNENTKAIVKTTLLFGAVAGFYFIIRSSILDNLAFQEGMQVINNSLAGADSYSDRLATTILILGKYLVLLVVPHPLSFDYSFNQIPIVSWASFGAISAVVAHLALVYALWKGMLKKIPIAFGIAFYLFTLAIVSNLFVEIGATMAERFMFTPSLGFVIVLALVLAKLVGYDSQTPKRRAPYFAIMGIIIVAYSLKTIDRNLDWKDNLTLFEADVLAAPNSARTHFSLAATYNTIGGEEKELDKKTELLNKAIQGFHTSLKIYPKYSAAWYNMGVAYFNGGDEDNALLAYKNCLSIDPSDKQALNNSGVIFFNRKDYKNAIDFFNTAISSHPDFPDPYANLGACFHNKGDYQNAISYYNKALRFDPNNRMVNGNLAKLYRSLGDLEKSNFHSAKTQ